LKQTEFLFFVFEALLGDADADLPVRVDRETEYDKIDDEQYEYQQHYFI
jgi:hypothetical protein